MYNSLRVLKNLDKDTKIYCGHEYTLKNSEFCLAQDSNNNELLNKIKEIEEFNIGHFIIGESIMFGLKNVIKKIKKIIKR